MCTRVSNSFIEYEDFALMSIKLNNFKLFIVLSFLKTLIESSYVVESRLFVDLQVSNMLYIFNVFII